MKKSLAMALLLLVGSTQTLYGNTLPTTVVNEVQTSKDTVAPITVNNQTLIPIRSASKTLGYQVKWDSKTHVVTIVTPSRTVVASPDTTTYTLNAGLTCHLEQPIQKVGNTLYAPISFFEDALGVKVTLNNGQVSLSDKLSPDEMLDDIVMPLQEGENTYYVNQKVGLSLEENPSTGYIWTVDVPLGVQVVSDHYTADSSSLVGAPGTHSWLFKATEPGTYTLVFKKVRPFEPDQVAATKTFVLNAETFKIPQ